MRRIRTFGRRGVEHLESRWLLASDTCQHDDEDKDETAAESIADLLSTAADDTFRAADAGSTLATAHDIGQLGAERSYLGSVGGSDTSDVMRFSVAARSQVTIGLGSLRADIDLSLYDSGGSLLATSNKSGTASESIVATLDAGTYYVLVAPWGTAASSYVLSARAAASTSTPTTPTNPTPPATPTTPTNPTSPVTAFPDVAYYGGSSDWNINSINAPESWARGYTGAGVVVAVVDTGVDLNHPDLVNQIFVNAGEIAGNGVDDDHNGYIDDVSGWDFASGDNHADDGNGHGTHVAGTIAADNNGFGATGVAPDAKIMPVRVLGSNGSGTANAVAAGIRYAAQMGADVINLSLGGSFSSVIQSAIQYAQQLNVLIVAASGNESAAVPGYPARFSSALSNVLSVGAYSSSGAIASFSNDVGSSGAVQVDAPGVGVYSTYIDGRYGTLSGTSMATPHVAGLAALALSANSSLTAAQLRNVIVNGANRAISGSDSRGGINAALTVALSAAGVTSSSTASAVQTQVTAQAVSIRGSIASSRAVQEGIDRFVLGASGDGGSSWSVQQLPASAAVPAAPSVAHDQALVDLLWADDADADLASVTLDFVATHSALDELLESTGLAV